MMRPPYGHGLHRSNDMEGGGAADLQTDVMRFMAILAICLVVIFALVQSIPLTPIDSSPVSSVAEQVYEPTYEPAEPTAVTPDPVPMPEPVAEPLPEPAVEAPGSVVDSPPPSPDTDVNGFTLRFESDAALARLVARNVVGLYAIDGQRALRMNYSRGRVSFWEASTPNQYHEMERTTVPADALNALLRTAQLDAANVKWGVTLPADMQDDLNGYLQSAGGGSLLIAADGRLRLEP